MNATNKRESVSKLMKAWESKNAKRAAQGAGLTTMAVTLAACGGSSSDETTTVAPPPPAPTAVAFTVAGNEQPATTSGNDTFTAVISTDSDKTTFDASDLLADASGTDTDKLTLTTEAELTAANTATVRNIETIEVNVDMIAGTTAANAFAAAMTNATGVDTLEFDVVNSNSVINTLNVTGVADKATVVASADFKTIDVTTAAAGNAISVNAQNLNAAVTINATTDPATATITGAGKLTVTAAEVTQVVSVSAPGTITVADASEAAVVRVDNTVGSIASSDATITTAVKALTVSAKSTGDVTIGDAKAATSVTVEAAGDVSLVNAGAGSINITAGGTITIAEDTGDAVDSTSAALAAAGTSTISDADKVTTATLSGNGGSATFNWADGDALSKIVVQGDQAVTLTVDASDIEGSLAVDDNATADFTLNLNTTAGAVDLSAGDVVDVLKVNVNLAAKALGVASGQTVTYTIDQATASDLNVGKAASAATNTVTLNLNDGSTSNNAAVDIADLTVKQAKSVLVNAGLDVNATGAATNLTSLAATAKDATLTVDSGANDLTITKAITAGASGNYGTIALKGSGDVTLAGDTNVFTANAATLDASALTGKLITTAGDTIQGAIATIKSGAGADTILLGANTITTVESGAGNDGITLAAADYGTKTVVIDGGAGSDTLTFLNGSKLSDLASGSKLAGIETIVFNATSTNQEIDAGLLNGATYGLKASATGATGKIIVDVASTDTAVDLSKLVESTDVSTTLAAMTFVTNASANSAAVTITGATDARNEITGSAAADDVLTGGAYVDTFVVSSDGLLFNASNVMLDTVAGGASTKGTYDEYLIGSAATAFTIVAADNWSKSTGVEQIRAIENTASYSLTLGASAETAGITRVDISAAGATGANTVSIAAYTAAGVTVTGSAQKDTITGGAGDDTLKGGAEVDTITGGAGNDTITGDGGADVLKGGEGDDTFVYAATADLFDSNAAVDLVDGGASNADTLLVGTTGTAFGVATTDVWTRVTNVEVIKAAANTSEVTIDFHASGWAAGIRTVDLSAGTSAASNVIDASEISGGGMTLIGASGATAITGGSGNDVIRGGKGNDDVSGGNGIDTYVFETTATLNGVDAITFVVADDKFDFTAFLGAGYSVLDGNGATAGIGSFTASANSDVDITGKVAVFEMTADTTTTIPTGVTAAEVFAEINANGNAFALTNGKAVIISVDENTDAAAGSPDPEVKMDVWFIDTTHDGLAGLSVSDILRVGNIDVTSGALFDVLSSDNFVN